MSQFAYDPFLDEDMNGSITKWEENQIEMQKYKRHIRETTRSLPIEVKSSTDGIEISHDNFHDLHFCFVVNGWKGVLNGISYMKHHFDVHPITAGSVTYRNTEMKKTTVKMIHHAVRCNAGLRGTSDGIAGGGDRVSNEILQTIQKYIQQNYKPYHSVNLSNGATEYGEFVSSISLNGEREDPSPIKLKITISFFGISLGGIYSRYAVGKLYEKLHSKESDNSNENSMVFPINFSLENITEDTTTNVSELDTTIHVPVYFNTYVSHLSPHLGLKDNTYIALNSFGENLMAKCTGPTGRDAFHKTSTFYDLATCGKYLEPLSLFHKRIAFSNSHHTDLMVTTNSGGFLHPGSSYPHHPIPLHDKYTADLESKDSKNILTSFSPKYLAGCYVTLPDHDILTSIKNKPEKDSSNKLIDMSNALDSLGWTKIFFECRDMTASVRLPSRRLLCFLQSIPKPDNGKFITTKHQQQQQQIINGDIGDEEEMMSKILTSQQLSYKLNNNADGHHSSAYWYIPESHALMTTRSKGRFTCVLCRRGRPLVNELINEVIHQIQAFEFPTS